MKIIMQTNTYSVLVNHSGICHGFAGALTYLYHKIGIDCRMVTETPLQTHAWNIIKMDDSFYQLDLTSDIEDGQKGLRYFNMTDAERRQTQRLQSWAESFGERMENPPICSDDSFSNLHDLSGVSVQNGTITYRDTKGEQKQVPLP